MLTRHNNIPRPLFIRNQKIEAFKVRTYTGKPFLLIQIKASCACPNRLSAKKLLRTKGREGGMKKEEQ